MPAGGVSNRREKRQRIGEANMRGEAIWRADASWTPACDTKEGFDVRPARGRPRVPRGSGGPLRSAGTRENNNGLDVGVEIDLLYFSSLVGCENVKN